jgi:hypothetical protein
MPFKLRLCPFLQSVSKTALLTCHSNGLWRKHSNFGVIFISCNNLWHTLNSMSSGFYNSILDFHLCSLRTRWDTVCIVSPEIKTTHPDLDKWQPYSRDLHIPVCQAYEMCGFLVWNLVLVTLLAPRFLRLALEFLENVQTSAMVQISTCHPSILNSLWKQHSVLSCVCLCIVMLKICAFCNFVNFLKRKSPTMNLV